MFQNGTILPAAKQFPLLTWSTPWSTLDTVFIAVLTTILSYQTAATLSDLLLGFKSKGNTSPSQMHSLLLGNEGSLLHSVAALVRRDFMDRVRLRPRAVIPLSTHIERNSSSIRVAVAIRLILLLSIPSLMNTLSIVVALERDDILSVSDAKFRGVSVGLLNKSEIQGTRGLARRICELIPASTEENDEMLLDFSICSGFFFVRPLYVGTNEYEEILRDEVQQGTRVMASDWPPGSISISFKQGVLEHIYRFWIDVRHDNEILRTKPKWSVDSARSLAKKAADSLILQCSLVLGRKPDIVEEMQYETQDDGVIRAWTTVGCEGSPQMLVLSALLFAPDVGTVETERFIVGKVDPDDGEEGRVAEFFEGGSLELIRRRKSLAPLGVLAVITTVSILSRVLVKFLTNADIDDAIDIVVRNVLGFGSATEETLLGIRDTFRIDHMYRYGEKVYLGLKVDEGEETETISGGLLGAAPKAPAEFCQ